MDYKHSDFWWKRITHNYGGKPFETAIYLKMLDIFCETGEIAGRGVAWPEDEPWREYDDPLLKYLTALMSDPEIKVQVLGNKLCAKVFKTSVGRFIVDCIHHQAFLSQCQRVEASQMAEVEDMTKTQSSWQKLITQIGERHKKDGFDTEFFKHMFSKPVSNEQKEKFLDDWGKAISESLRQSEEKHVNSVGSSLKANIPRLLENARSAMSKDDITDEQAVQAWQMMDGHWSESEFLKQMNVVRMQDRCPQLNEVVNKMGRVADSNGKDRLTVSSGQKMKISHSSGSDITGISIGSDLSSLLPMELAMYSDKDMEDIFYYRYTRNRLQTFDYKSKMSKPSRKLSFQHARRVGPMIVCVDTSASMFGPPQRIIKLQLSLLEEDAERLNRDCFLIDFSVGIKTIDLRQRMKQKFYKSIGLQNDEAQFDRGHIPFIGGGTNAKNMIEATFQLLDSGDYVNADVLWISDFLIPLSSRPDLDKIKEYRKTGTRFYGLCIRPKGEKGSDWTPVFDKIYDIEYRIIRKY